MTFDFKLRHCDALVHSDVLFNYLEQEDEGKPSEKMMVRNLRDKFTR